MVRRKGDRKRSMKQKWRMDKSQKTENAINTDIIQSEREREWTPFFLLWSAPRYIESQKTECIISLFVKHRNGSDGMTDRDRYILIGVTMSSHGQDTHSESGNVSERSATRSAS